MTVNTNSQQRARNLASTFAIAFFTLSTIILLANGSLALYTNILSYRDSVSIQQQLIAQDASQTVRNFILEKVNTMETAVSFASPITATPDMRNVFMDGLLGSDPSFRQFVILNTRGINLADTSSSLIGLSSQFSANIESALLQTSKGEYYFSPVYIDDTTSEPLITVAVPIRNIFGDTEGSLLGEIGLKFLWDLVDQIKVGETGYAYVVDDKGNLIAFSDTARVLAGENVGQIGEVKEFLENPSSAVDITPEATSYKGLLGADVLGTYVPLGTPEWAVISELPTTEAYGPIYRAVAASIATILLMAVLAGLAGIAIGRRLAVPLISLTETATRIANGDIQLQATLGGTQETITLATAFNNMTLRLRDVIGSLERRVSERTVDLETARLLSENRAQDLQSISEISRTISTEQRLDVLLPLITRLVSERFDFYHVGIFFVDDTRRYAYLQAANSEGGQRMLARGHRLELGTGLVGTVSQTGRSRIALDVGVDASFFNNPDLPTTRSEMVLPLNVRGVTIGALDVQSTKSGAFTENDANTLGILADQIAIAIENARLFGQSQQAREEAENLYAQVLNREWNAFIKQEEKIGYQQTSLGGKQIAKPVETEEIREALANGQVVIVEGTEKNEQPSIAIPVTLRGKTIGVLNIKAPTKARRWNRDEINLAQAVSDRLALALDNVRLLQESQRRAAKEAKIGEVTAKIGASINMSNVLQTAVEELGRALPGSEVMIQFQADEEN